MSNQTIQRHGRGAQVAGQKTGGQFKAHERADAVFTPPPPVAVRNPATPTFNQLLDISTDDWYNIPWKERKTVVAEALDEVLQHSGSEATFKGWSRSERALGRTLTHINRYTGEIKREVELSDSLLRYKEPITIADTIAHEVAHSTSHPRAGHGPEWVTHFENLKTELNLDTELKTGHKSTPAEVEEEHRLNELKKLTSPWLGVCPQGHEFPAGRKPKRGYICMKCSRNGDEALITYERNPNRQ